MHFLCCLALHPLCDVRRCYVIILSSYCTLVRLRLVLGVRARTMWYASTPSPVITKYPSHLQVGNEHKNHSAQLHQSSALPERKSDKTALITATFMTAAVKILSFCMYTKELKCQLTPHPVGHRK